MHTSGLQTLNAEHKPVPEPTIGPSEVAPKQEAKPYKGDEAIAHLHDKASKAGNDAAKATRGPAEEAGRKVDEAASEAKKEGKQAVNAVEREGKKLAHDAEDVADEASRKAKQGVAEAKKQGKKLAGEAEELAGEAADKARALGKDAKREAQKLGKEARRELDKAENAAARYYEQAKDILLRPGTLGGLVGIANVGLLSSLGYYAYTRRDVPGALEPRRVGAAVAGILALFGAETVVAEQFATTPEGKRELERAKQEGSHLYKHAREIVLRPGVAGGLLGALNLAVLGTVGYFAHQNWNKPAWDRRLVAGVTFGLISLSAAEGLAAETYRQKELPEQKRKGNF